MKNKQLEFKVGLFVMIGLFCIIFIALEVANVTSIRSRQYYQLHAKFENIGSLKVRSPVKVGGVRIGHVSDIQLDPETYTPIVTMQIDGQFDHFPDTSSVEILTAGLIGEQYIGFKPGFEFEDSEWLTYGDYVEDTKSAIVLEDLIGQFIYRVGGE